MRFKFNHRNRWTRLFRSNDGNSTAPSTEHSDNRRSALRKIAILPVVASAPAWFVSETAFAGDKCQGQTPKAALQYQDKPKGSNRCDNCAQFCPGAKPSAMGTCKIVKGSISPKGWCSAWTPKS